MTRCLLFSSSKIKTNIGNGFSLQTASSTIMHVGKRLVLGIEKNVIDKYILFEYISS